MKRSGPMVLIVCGILLMAGCTEDVDTDPPSGLEVTIDDNAEYTNSTSVVLKVQVSKEPYEVSFSNDGQSWSAWERYREGSEVPWTLSDGDGVKTVYFKARDKAKNKAKSVNDTIILDTISPTILSSKPTNGQKAVPIKPVIEVIFSEPIKDGPKVELTPSVIGNWNWRSSEELEFQYECVLTPGTTYTISWGTGLNDLAGNGLTEAPIKFTTRDPVSVTGNLPMGSGVDVTTDLTVTFDRDMNHTRTEHAFKVRPSELINDTTSNMDFKFEWADNTMTVDIKGTGSSDILEFDTEYVVIIEGGPNGATDAEGGILLQNHTWRFSTRPLEVVVVSHSLFHHNTSDYTYLYGEIKNNGPYNLNYIELNVVFYGLGGNKIYEETVTASPFSSTDAVKPGEKWPFSTRVGDKNGDITSVTIAILGAKVMDLVPYSGIEVMTEHVFDDNATFTVNGTVKNIGNEGQSKVSVIATFYNSAGIVYGVASAGTTPYSVGIGQEADYQVSVFLTLLLCR